MPLPSDTFHHNLWGRNWCASNLGVLRVNSSNANCISDRFRLRGGATQMHSAQRSLSPRSAASAAKASRTYTLGPCIVWARAAHGKDALTPRPRWTEPKRFAPEKITTLRAEEHQKLNKFLCIGNHGTSKCRQSFGHFKT